MNWDLIGDLFLAVFFTAMTWWLYIHPRGVRVWQTQTHPATVDFVRVVPWVALGYWIVFAWRLTLPMPMPWWASAGVTWIYLYFLSRELIHLGRESVRIKRRPNR